MVENGKTSVEFDLVLGTLRALGYHLNVGSSVASLSWAETSSYPGIQSHDPSPRTPLTRGGEPLGRQRSKRRQAPEDRD